MLGVRAPKPPKPILYRVLASVRRKTFRLLDRQIKDRSQWPRSEAFILTEIEDQFRIQPVRKRMPCCILEHLVPQSPQYANIDHLFAFLLMA